MMKRTLTATKESPTIPVDTLLTAGFHALSDPIRYRIVELLRSGEFCVCDLCEHLGVAQSKLSFHLKVLRRAHLVVGRQEGRWIYYRLNLGQFNRLTAYLTMVCGVNADERIARYCG